MTHLKEDLKKFLNNKKKQTQQLEKIEKILDKVLGRKISPHINLKRIYKNQLFFQSTSSCFSYEFNLRKQKLLEEIKKVYPEITDLKIKIA